MLLGLFGFTTACGKVLVLNPSPSSPLDPVVSRLATVTGEPNVSPWSVLLRIMMRCGLLWASYQNAYTAWSGPTVIQAPWVLLPVVMATPPLGPQVAP